MISADAAATHQSVIRVMEAARLAGLSQITFTTQSAQVSEVLVPPRRHRLAAVAGEPRLSALWCSCRQHPLPAADPQELAPWHPGHRGRQPHGRRQRQDAARALDRGIPQEQRLVAGHRLARLRRERSPSRARPPSLRAPPRSATSRSCSRAAAAARCGSGADRVRVAALLRAAHEDVNVLILDDGLQHYALRRDLEIAVVDARGFGNGFLLPAGPLREPPSRLRSVDAVVSHASARAGSRHDAAGRASCTA